MRIHLRLQKGVIHALQGIFFLRQLCLQHTAHSKVLNDVLHDHVIHILPRGDRSVQHLAALRTLDEVGDVHDAVHVLMRHPQRQHRTNQQRRTRAEQHK